MADLIGKVAIPPILHRSSMAKMIMADHRNSLFCQEAGEWIVPKDMLRHSVRNQKKLSHLSVRFPQNGMQS